MPLISLPYIFSSGTTIIASQTNSNNTTFLNLLNGGLDNTNFTGTAGITYANMTLTGSILNSDINSSAAIASSKLNFGSFNQGDVFVDKGSGIARLTHGVSGQFLQTQGASSNSQWATVSIPSNVLFQYSGSVDQKTDCGEVEQSSLNYNSNTAGIYRYLYNSNGSTVKTVWSSKFTKIMGINTITIYARAWNATTDTTTVTVSVGGQTGSSTTSSTTPVWINFTIDVSSLTNTTVYDVFIQLSSTGANSICGTLISFGS